MFSTLGQSAQVYNAELGEFVSDDHQRFAEVLKDLKPTYNLVYIPKKDRVAPEDHLKPWAILDTPDNQREYVVRTMTDEEMKEPHKILAWLFDGDLVRHGAENVLRRIENEEKAKQLMELRRREDELEDMIDYADFMFTGGRDKKHTIQHNGRKFER
jgi:hypothetical protein